MPSKTEEYLALAQRTANGLTRYWESWTDYLTTASRLYKYPFADQLMIYAQRPDATACADYDIWNNRMNRYVRRGSKGIALLDESSGFPRLHYVFDVSDTGVRRNSRDPDLWQYNDDLKQPVSEMLAATYGISGERVSQQLADVAGKLVADYWDNNGEDMYEFDLGVLNSERAYITNTMTVSGAADDCAAKETSDFKQYEKAVTVTDTYHETKSRFAWIGEIENEQLLTALETLKVEDLEIITMYAYEGYDITEISKVYGVSRPTISIKIKRITKFLKNFNFNATN